MTTRKVLALSALSVLAMVATLTAASGSPAGASPATTKAKPAVDIDPGAWVQRQTVSTSAVTDSQGNVWSPAIGITGGTEAVAPGGIGSTGSQALYQPQRTGITKWAVTVPAAGEYAVNLLLADSSGDAAGARVFTITTTAGTVTTTLATNLDLVAKVKGWQAYHVTGMIAVSGTTFSIKFAPSAGRAIVSALEVESDGPIAARTSELNDTFYGAAGSQANPTLWNYTTGTGYEGTSGVEDYTSARANSELDGSGNLAINAIRANNGSSTYTSAEMNTNGTFAFGYGTVTAVAKVPGGSGMWPAIWAVGTNENTVNWPTCGEIDVMEGFYGINGNNDDVSGHVHSLGNSSDPIGGSLSQHVASLGRDQNVGVDTSAAFHTYSETYLPGSITFSFDGAPYFTAAPEDLASGESWPFTGEGNFLILDLAVGDTSATGNAPTEALGTTHTMLIQSINVTN